MARYIFVTGGVVSSLGKGLSSASLAYLLKSQGFKVRIRKMDPYLNVDPGTMSPFQHGEVFVTDDGAVNNQNINNLKQIREINGFLIGGASQNSKKFIDIIKKTIN